jgi:hypothetical protein
LIHQYPLFVPIFPRLQETQIELILLLTEY